MFKDKKIFNEVCSFTNNNMITFRKILFGEFINYSQSMIGYVEKKENLFEVYNWKGIVIGVASHIEEVYSLLNINNVYPFDCEYELFQKWQMDKMDNYILQERIKTFSDIYQDYHSNGKIH